MEGVVEGRIVHFALFEAPDRPYAAIISDVTDEEAGEVTLVVFNKVRLHGEDEVTNIWEKVPYSLEPKWRHWSWPPRK